MNYRIERTCLEVKKIGGNYLLIKNLYPKINNNEWPNILLAKIMCFTVTDWPGLAWPGLACELVCLAR